MSDWDVRTAVMAALDLAQDYAYHDGSPRELAVAAEAYGMAGYSETIGIASPDEVNAAVDAARRGLPKRLLRAEARGMLQAFDLLARSGGITYRSVLGVRKRRLLARDGRERV